MSDCFHLSDRMPEVVRGQVPWSAEEAAHLRACADCRAELQLVRTTLTLGARAGAERDASPIAARVLARLRSEPVAAPGLSSRARRSGWALAAAAALVLTVWTVAPERGDPAAEPTLAAMLHELDDLDEAELERLFGSVTGFSSDGTRPFEATDSWADLTEAELVAVLSTLEG